MNDVIGIKVDIQYEPTNSGVYIKSLLEYTYEEIEQYLKECSPSYKDPKQKIKEEEYEQNEF